MRLSFKMPIFGFLDILGSTKGFLSISGVLGGVSGDETGGNESAAGVEVITSFLVPSFCVGGGSRGVSVGGY